MAAQLLSLRILTALLVCAVADPAPGRIPKVYNALITSNQNLEPSKAYPVYQPVLHDAFAFSYQPAVFYGGDLISSGLLPAAGPIPKSPLPKEAATGKPKASDEAITTAPEVSSSSTEAPPAPESSKSESKGDATPAPPLPPNTQSPIPLNEFGLPPQVLPLSHIDPLYNALPQFSPFAYRFPGIRFYDPYDPFSFSPYAGFPLYRPVTNVLGPSFPGLPGSSLAVVPNKETVAADVQSSSEKSSQTPPPEPSDLNILNYSSKDPAIPNVPPPPLPQGGLKSDKDE